MEDLQVTSGESFEHQGALALLLSTETAGVTQAPVSATREDHLRMPDSQAKGVEHGLNLEDVIEVAGDVQRGTPGVKLVLIEEGHRAAFDLDPLDQVPLEETEAGGIKMLEDLFIAGQCPDEMTPAIIASVKVKRGVDAPAPVFAISRASGHLQRVPDQMHQA
jgi:hypothetical protein